MIKWEELTFVWLKNCKENEKDGFKDYLEKLRSMASDIENANYLPTCNTIFGSMMDTQTFESIEQMKVGLCIFSPPYANCFDYCEVYKLELWLGGFVNDYADFERYRSMAMRSHVNSKFDHQISNKNDDVDLIAELVSAFNVWNKNIIKKCRNKIVSTFLFYLILCN